MIKKTVIIGNGFDLDLKLPTSYQDFVNSEIFNKTRNGGNKLYEYIYAKYKDCNWTDIENLLKEYANCKPPTEEFYSDYCILKKDLKEYVKSIDFSNVDKNQNCKAAEVLGRVCLDCSIRRHEVHTTILNFNYTNTIGFMLSSKYAYLNEIADVSNIANLADLPVELHNVHGSVNNDIILGVEDEANISKEYNFIKKSYSPQYKNLVNKLLGSDEVVIFGHSLGETDEAVFKPFFQQQITHNAARKNIIIYYKGESKYPQMIARLDALTGNMLPVLRQLNTVELRDVDTYTQPVCCTISDMVKLVLFTVENFQKIIGFISTILRKN